MGTPAIDCKQVATLIGVKTFTNEFIAYQDLALLRKNRILVESWANDAVNHTVLFNEINNCYTPQNSTYTHDCLPIISVGSPCTHACVSGSSGAYFTIIWVAEHTKDVVITSIIRKESRQS